MILQGLKFLRDSLRVLAGGTPSSPFVVGLTINTTCNLRCSYCFIGREEEHFPEGFAKVGLGTDEIKAVLRNIRKDTGMLIITGGEPFLRKDFEEVLQYAKRDLRFVNISVATNGMFLKKKPECLQYIDRLGISYDFTRAREYPKQMEEVLGDLVELKRQKKLPPVHFTMTLLRSEDLSPIESFAKYCLDNDFHIWVQPEREHGDFREWGWFVGLVKELKSKHGDKLFLNDLGILQTFAVKDPSYQCLPILRLHVNEDGKLCFPCNRLEHKYPTTELAAELAEGLVTQRRPTEIWNEAVKKHGEFPREECNGCGFTCYFETAGLFRRPHNFARTALRHMTSSS